jgi:ABC-type polysaccharide/polyol phosphate export permease
VAHILSYNPMLVLGRSYRAIFLEGHAPALGPLAALWIGQCWWRCSGMRGFTACGAVSRM